MVGERIGTWKSRLGGVLPRRVAVPSGAMDENPHPRHSGETRQQGGRRETPPTRPATLLDAALPVPDPRQEPWPADQVVLDGCGIQVRHTPSPNADAEPAVYVHGLGGDATNWTEMAGLLAPWLDGLALDLPGFGGSDPAPGGDYSLARHARTVVRLIERHGAPVHLFGNSMGGAACVMIAAHRPDLVRTLTLVAPAMPDLRPRTGTTAPMQAMLLPGAVGLVDRYLARFTVEQRVEALIATCFGDPAAIPPHRLEQAVEEARRRAALPWSTAALVKSLRGLVATYLTVGERSLWARAGRIAAPTLVVWGTADQLVDVSLAPRTARCIPDSRLLVLPGLGHVPQMEDPDSVARAFLALRADVAARRREGERAEPSGGAECERLPG